MISNLALEIVLIHQRDFEGQITLFFRLFQHVVFWSDVFARDAASNLLFFGVRFFFQADE